MNFVIVRLIYEVGEHIEALCFLLKEMPAYREAYKTEYAVYILLNNVIPTRMCIWRVYKIWYMMH